MSGREHSEHAVVEEDVDVEVLLQCHDYHVRPEPAALDTACEIEAQRLWIEELRKRLKEVSLKQSFGLERFSASDDNIRFYTRYVLCHDIIPHNNI